MINSCTKSIENINLIFSNMLVPSLISSTVSHMSLQLKQQCWCALCRESIIIIVKTYVFILNFFWILWSRPLSNIDTLQCRSLKQTDHFPKFLQDFTNINSLNILLGVKSGNLSNTNFLKTCDFGFYKLFKMWKLKKKLKLFEN